jgi:hypothetical protein
MGNLRLEEQTALETIKERVQKEDVDIAYGMLPKENLDLFVIRTFPRSPVSRLFIRFKNFYTVTPSNCVALVFFSKLSIPLHRPIALLLSFFLHSPSALCCISPTTNMFHCTTARLPPFLPPSQPRTHGVGKTLFCMQLARTRLSSLTD